MEQTLTANVTYLPGAQPGQDVGEAKNSGFWADFTLSGICREFVGAVLPKKSANINSEPEDLKGLKIACTMADDIKKQEKVRREFVGSLFMQDDAKGLLAKFLVLHDDKPREGIMLAIRLVARMAEPGKAVNLVALAKAVAEAMQESANPEKGVSQTFIREAILPLMKEIGLIVQPKEGVNGWQWRDMEKKASVRELAQKAMQQAALVASPAHRELVDEQAKRYALHLQEKALKQRLMQEKANQQLIQQVQGKAEENEKAMIELGMKQTVSNTPAWIAGGVVALLAAAWLVGNGHPANPQPEGQAAAYEQAPAYTGGAAGAAPAPPSPEDILRQQYRIAHMDWDKLPAATRNNILKEFAEQQAAMAATQGTAQGAGQ